MVLAICPGSIPDASSCLASYFEFLIQVLRSLCHDMDPKLEGIFFRPQELVSPKGCNRSDVPGFNTMPMFIIVNPSLKQLSATLILVHHTIR